AAQASKATGAVIASHTIGGKVAKEEMDVLEAAGHDLQRFIWIHAQSEPDVTVLKEAAARGAYIELDSIGAPNQSEAELVDTILALMEAGYLDHILLSHDAGWYNPGRPDGMPDHGFRGYTALTKEFLPAVSARGISDELIQHITMSNPARAFAF
ncbi:MAG TPA: esterase, partial [Anaerolineales bacterium]|nr:esterase [Anaerolineales bacterium]